MATLLERLRERGIVTGEPFHTAVHSQNRSPEEVVEMIEEQKKQHRWCVQPSRKFWMHTNRYNRRLKGGIDREEY